MTDNFLVKAKPLEIAEKFRAAKWPTLINHQNEWMAYDIGGAYRPIEDRTILQSLSAFMKAAKQLKGVDAAGKPIVLPFNPTPRDVNGVAEMLKNICHRPIETMTPPVFLDGGKGAQKGLDPDNLISLRNGLLDIRTRKLYPPTPQFFTLTALPIEYDPNAPAPERWLAFMSEVTDKRADLIELIQETFGYIVSPDTSLHKVFFWYGRPRSGKGTTLHILDKLIGDKNVKSPTIETLGGRFGYQSLLGASLAQVTDMDCDNKNSLSTAASRINAVSGEDAITAERKNIGDWNGKLPARFVLAGNNLPNFGSHTLAMDSRLLIVPFDVSFRGREDRRLRNKLEAELAGILNWALDGLDRLTERGDFAEPDASIAAKRTLLYQSNPVHGFLDECCTVKPGAGVDKVVLYDAFTTYCGQLGISHTPSAPHFGRDLMNAEPKITAGKRRRKRGDDDRIPCYRGVRLNDRLQREVYKLDSKMMQAMAALDDTPTKPIFEKDAAGWPVPRDSVEFSV